MDAVARLHSQMAMLGRNVNNIADDPDAEASKLTSLEEVNMNVNDFRPEVTAATAKLEDVFNFVLMEFTRSLQVQKDELTKAIDPIKSEVEKLHLKVDYLEKNDSKSTSTDLSKMVRNIMISGVTEDNFGPASGEEEKEEPGEQDEGNDEEKGGDEAEGDPFSVEKDEGGDSAAPPAPEKAAAAANMFAKAGGGKGKPQGVGMSGLETMQSFAALKQELTVLATTVQWMRQDIKNRRELQTAKDTQQDQVIKMELERLERVVQARMLSDAEFATEIERVKQQVTAQLQTQELTMTSMITEAAKGLESHMNQEVGTVIGELAEMRDQASEQSRLQEEKIEQVQQEVLEWFREQQFEQQILALQNEVKLIHGTLFEHGAQLELLEKAVTQNTFNIEQLTAKQANLEKVVKDNKAELEASIAQEAKNTDEKIKGVMEAMSKQEEMFKSELDKRDKALDSFKENVVQERQALEARQEEARQKQDAANAEKFATVNAAIENEAKRADEKFAEQTALHEKATTHRGEMEEKLAILKEELEIQKQMAVGAAEMDELKDEMKEMARKQESAGEEIDATKGLIKKVQAESLSKEEANVIKQDIVGVKTEVAAIGKKVNDMQSATDEKLELMKGEMDATKAIAESAKASAKECGSKLFGLESEMERRIGEIDESLQGALAEQAKAKAANEGMEKIVGIVEKVEGDIFEIQEQVKNKVDMQVFENKTDQLEHSINTVTKDVRMCEENIAGIRREMSKKITKTEVEAVVDDAMEVIKAEQAQAKDMDGLSAGYFKCLSCDSTYEEMHTKPTRVNTNVLGAGGKNAGPATQMSPPGSRQSTPQQGALRPPLGNGFASGGQMMANTTGSMGGQWAQAPPPQQQQWPPQQAGGGSQGQFYGGGGVGSQSAPAQGGSGMPFSNPSRSGQFTQYAAKGQTKPLAPNPLSFGDSRPTSRSGKKKMPPLNGRPKVQQGAPLNARLQPGSNGQGQYLGNQSI